MLVEDFAFGVSRMVVRDSVNLPVADGLRFSVCDLSCSGVLSVMLECIWFCKIKLTSIDVTYSTININ